MQGNFFNDIDAMNSAKGPRYFSINGVPNG
jgi:hypothetical protein